MSRVSGGAASGIDAVDVILRDGSTLRLRAPEEADREPLVKFFDELSPRSLYLRFHGQPPVDDRLVEPVLESDWIERGALLASMTEAGGDRIVALANYVRLRDPASAEVAFTVADAYQGRGIATRLLEQLAPLAAARGIERFVGEVMADNAPMIGVFEGVGFEVSRTFAGGEVEMTFPIATTPDYASRVEARDHTAVVASLGPFFEARSVAVIGASPRRGTIGGELFRNILAGEFVGAAYPVNRNGESVAGVRGYGSIVDVPDPVDLAVVCVPAAAVLESVSSALDAGIRAVCVISAGFAEVGSEGEERQRALLAAIRAHGARLLGPNCLGISSAAVRLNATFASRSAPPGNIGFSSQSGALGLALLEATESRGLGLSAFVSIGNKADVSSNDLLEWWEDDPATEVVLLYLESFGNPRRFGTIARRVARTKPILAVKSGTTGAGARAASSHTAALAGSEAAVDALFHQAGVIRASSLEELIDVAALLSTQPMPRGRRVAVLTNAGGLGILCADACEAVGLELPQLSEYTIRAIAPLLPGEASLANPVDMLGSASDRSYEQVLPFLLADTAVDAIVALFVPAVSATAEAVGGAIARAATAAAEDKPVLAVVMSAEGIPMSLRAEQEVAAFTYPESAARALGRAAERADWLRRPLGSVPELDGVDAEAALAVTAPVLDETDGRWLEPTEARQLLLAYGIPLVPERVATSVEDAIEARDRARLSRRDQDGGGGCTQDRDRRHRSRSGQRCGGSIRRSADRAARRRAADDLGRNRAPLRSRPGPGLRPARRIRTRWRACRADRRGVVPDCSVNRRRCRGARVGGKGGPPRTWVPGCTRGRRARSRRSRPTPLASRAGCARACGAGSQPSAGTSGPMRRRRRPRAHSATRSPDADEDVVEEPARLSGK